MPTASEAMAAAAAAPAPAAPAPAAPAPAGGGAPPPSVVPARTGQEPAGPAFYDDWKDPTQKDVREWVANKRYADPFTLARSARELEQQLGTLRGQRPAYPAREIGPDGKPTPAYEQAMKAWRMTAGVPETADKYELPTNPNNPYPEFTKSIAEMFHENGVPAPLAKQLAEGWESRVAAAEAQMKAQEALKSEQAVLELQHAWGPQFQERAALAKRGWDFISSQTGGLNEQQLRGLESVLGTEKFMSVGWKLGAGNSEARFAGDNGGARPMEGGASQAQSRYAQLNADRAAGKISDHQWRELQPTLDGLISQITGGTPS